MQVNLTELKRKKLCPILYSNEWDYTENDPHFDFFKFCLEEIMRWHYRKGRGISGDVLPSLISNFAVQKSVSRLEISGLQSALKSFTKHGLYSKIDNMISNAEIQVGVGNGNVITHILPTLSSIKENTYIITWDEKIRTIEDLMQSYEVMLASVWSFYSLNRYPKFYNLYYEDKEVHHIEFKPDQFYVRDSKAFFLKMQNLIEDQNIYPAPVELCWNCDRRFECQTSKTRTKKH